MVSTKRQIMRDRDRFGGFAEESSRVATESRADVYDAYENVTPPDITSTRSYAPQPQTVISDELSDISIKSDSDITQQSMLSQSTAPVMSERRTEEELPTYTTAPMTDAAPAPVTEQPLYTTRYATELPPRPVKERKTYDKEDIMPSIKTRSYAQGAVAMESQAAEAHVPMRGARERRALDPKTKVMLVVYVAVALVLAIAVIATGVSISQASASVSALSESIAQKQQVVNTQNERIAELTDDGHIRDEAMHRGMMDADTTVTVNRAESVEYPAAEVHTNSFDGFCDAIGNILM